VTTAGTAGRDPTLPLDELMRAFPFPDVARADRHGLLAYGGDLSPERLISAYAQGVFPWYEEDPVLWFSPDPRMVLEPADLVVNRSLRKCLGRRRYQVRVDSDFRAVIEACATVPRVGQAGTWITADMVAAYCELHELGFAHSVESWHEGVLVGGIYGVSLGAAFFGESMFALRSNASKVALWHLVALMNDKGFHFLDCQAHTPHMERLGARERPRDEFLSALGRALEEPTRRGRWSLPSEASEEAPC